VGGADSSAISRAASADALIFDVDGVLVDVNDSLRMVTCNAVQFYLTSILSWKTDTFYVVPHDIAFFKSAGGFNDDWDLTRAFVLLYLVKANRLAATHATRLRRAAPTIGQVTRALRQSAAGYAGLQRLLLDPLDQAARSWVLGRWDAELIARVFKEHFAGKKFCREFYGFDPQYYFGPAYIDRDRPLVDPRLLAAGNWKLGLYTGRTLAESKHAISLIGAEKLFQWEHVVTADDSIYKPNPRGLELLAQRMGFKRAVFFGDMPDDAEAALRYRCSAGVCYSAKRRFAAKHEPSPAARNCRARVPTPPTSDVGAHGRAPAQLTPSALPEILFAYVTSGRRANLWRPPHADIETPSVNTLLRLLLRPKP
jgi:HAD superfamily hydrolase (TIGR01548 family)